MGCFDCITFRCPNCGTEHEAQSKSGACVLDTYNHASVPMNVAYDANRHAPFKCACGSSWYFGNIPDDNARIALTIIPANEKG